MNLTLSSSVSLYAKDMFKLLLLHVSGNENGSLVLLPGMNTDGAFFLKEFPDRIEQSDYSKNYGIYALRQKCRNLLKTRIWRYI